MIVEPLNYRCRIEQKSVTQDASYGTEVVTWTVLATRWCSISDMLPSRGEALRNDLAININRSRVRFRHCTDIDSSMRFVIWRPTETVYQIVSGPAERGNKESTEFIVERVSS